MSMDDLLKRTGAWLETSTGDQIVISSRVRLARNLAAFPFMTKANRTQRGELHATCKQRLLEAIADHPVFYVDMENTSSIERQLLVERHLISKQLASGEGSRGVAISDDETCSIMVNEEDHLRLQVLRAGEQLATCWRQADDIDSRLQERLPYAFSTKLGYLTACPTNVGTGLRVSVMVHLPALKLTGDIARVFEAAKEMHLAIRGLFGEGTEAIGDFYQISNQTTLGRSEAEILSEFTDSIIPKIIQMEKINRQILENERPLLLDDKIGRAIGVLKNARLLTTEETLFFLSHLRLGVAMKRVAGVSMATINALFLQTQPAHLQKLLGKELDNETRRGVRAEYVRKVLQKAGA
ncbi:MAG: protein arginine kinase [Phycisphaerales bacterium]|nr:protein arginine kinase [Phycisphaerales bacterium]